MISSFELLSYETTCTHPNAGQSNRSKAHHIFVRDGAKPMIRAPLADGGYGTSFQAGMVNMLNDLMRSQRRKPVV